MPLRSREVRPARPNCRLHVPVSGQQETWPGRQHRGPGQDVTPAPLIVSATPRLVDWSVYCNCRAAIVMEVVLMTATLTLPPTQYSAIPTGAQPPGQFRIALTNVIKAEAGRSR